MKGEIRKDKKSKISRKQGGVSMKDMIKKIIIGVIVGYIAIHLLVKFFVWTMNYHFLTFLVGLALFGTIGYYLFQKGKTIFLTCKGWIEAGKKKWQK